MFITIQKNLYFKLWLLCIFFFNKVIICIPSQYKTSTRSEWVTSQDNTIQTESTTDQSGFSVAINGNGTILAIGEPGWPNGNDQGRTRTFILTTGGNWSGIGNITGENAIDLSGSSLAINNQGNILAIGEPGWTGGTNQGRTRTFIFTGGNWSGIGEGTGTNMTGEFSGDLSGSSLALNFEGDTLMILEPGWNGGNDYGRIKIFKLTNSIWSLSSILHGYSEYKEKYGSLGAITIDDTENYIFAAGNYLVLSEDIHKPILSKLSSPITSLSYNGTGNIFIAGAPESNQIEIHQAKRTTRIELNTDKQDDFGNSVKISRDGTHFIIGSPGFHNGNGYVEIRKIGEETIFLHTGDSVYKFGYAVTSDDKAETIVIGAPGKGGIEGKTFIYNYKPVILPPIFAGNSPKKPNRHLPGVPTDISQPNNGDTIPVQGNR